MMKPEELIRICQRELNYASRLLETGNLKQFLIRIDRLEDILHTEVKRQIADYYFEQGKKP